MQPDPPTGPPAPLRENLRADFLLEPGVTFVNHGSFGAVPRCVFDAHTDWRLRIEQAPVERIARRNVELLAPVKTGLGAWLGMRPDDFGFVTNATEGVNAVLRSLDLSPGDEIMATDHVYPAVRQAMGYVAIRTGAVYRQVRVPLPVRSANDVADAVVGGMTSWTRLVVIDHVTSPTGLVFPVEAIAARCAARGVKVLVDGAHAPGMLDLDVPQVGAAYYAGNLHKWVCAPKGTAFLWVRPDKQAAVHPLVISHHLGEGFAREFGWQGTRDLAAWLAAPRAAAYFEDLGWERVRAHNHALAAWAHRLLCDCWGVEPISPLDGRMLGSMATVLLPASLQRMTEVEGRELQQRLYDEFRVEAPLMLWNGRWLLRVSCQVYNVPAEYERVADVIGRVSGAK